mmetsp:Transcript_26401/g.73923  ORF Transcript_26401/g.73923 Transcript_26401/m.73923 type:complete len:104 (+) Transcript_26401:242-553(+)|eukprot:scaffold193173_cov38-Tisochrysis_lutea.AAC.1
MLKLFKKKSKVKLGDTQSTEQIVYEASPEVSALRSSGKDSGHAERGRSGLTTPAEREREGKCPHVGEQMKFAYPSLAMDIKELQITLQLRLRRSQQTRLKRRQ